MASIQKREDGWVAIGDTVEDLLLGALAIEQLPALKTKMPKTLDNTRTEKSSEPDADGKKSRLEQLEEFLVKNGPMSRGDVILKAGMPKGTINTTLNDKNFKQLPDGRWTGERVSKI